MDPQGRYVRVAGGLQIPDPKTGEIRGRSLSRLLWNPEYAIGDRAVRTASISKVVRLIGSCRCGLESRRTEMRSVKHTREKLSPIVAASTSIAQVLKALELRPSGGNYCHIQRKILEYGLDRSHFLGKGANRGDTHRGPKRLSWEEILVHRACGRRAKAHVLRRALIEMGRDYRCQAGGCANPGSWLGRPLMLQVNHINGDWRDDRSENLQFLCPNCHSQTDNWCGTRGLSDITTTCRADRLARRNRPRGGTADALLLGGNVLTGVGVRVSPGPLAGT